MGEAKRRKELSIPPRKKIINIEKYPYMGVATMALGAFILLVSGGFNTIN